VPLRSAEPSRSDGCRSVRRRESGQRALWSASANAENKQHERDDAAVLAAYGFSAKQDLLAQLLALNLDVTARIATAKPVVAPGIPPNYPHPDRLITDDCIRAS